MERERHTHIHHNRPGVVIAGSKSHFCAFSIDCEWARVHLEPQFKRTFGRIALPKNDRRNRERLSCTCQKLFLFHPMKRVRVRCRHSWFVSFDPRFYETHSWIFGPKSADLYMGEFPQLVLPFFLFHRHTCLSLFLALSLEIGTWINFSTRSSSTNNVDQEPINFSSKLSSIKSHC